MVRSFVRSFVRWSMNEVRFVRSFVGRSIVRRKFVVWTPPLRSSLCSVCGCFVSCCLFACLLVCLFVCSLLVGCCWLDGGGRVVVVLGVRLLCSLDFGEPMECVMCCSGLFVGAIACCALCVGCDRPIWWVHWRTGTSKRGREREHERRVQQRNRI